MDHLKFHRHLRDKRKQQKLTPKFFAAQIGITVERLRDLEAGRSPWTSRLATRAVSVLNRGEAWPDVVQRNKH